MGNLQSSELRDRVVLPYLRDRYGQSGDQWILRNCRQIDEFCRGIVTDLFHSVDEAFDFLDCQVQRDIKVRVSA